MDFCRNKNTSMPKKLFIIGNGFDCYLHGLPTKYSDFRDYILDCYPNAEEFQGVPGGVMMPRGDILYEEEEVAGYIIRIIDFCEGEEWSALEACLGSAIFGEFGWDLSDIDFEEKDNEIFRSITANEDIANDIENTFVGIKKLFGDWVTEKLGGLDYNRCYRKNVADVVSGDSRFLNFNYTLTLEKVYRIKQNKVCHIHGKVGDPEEAIYFGHGSDEEIEDAELHWGTELSFNELKRRLRKNTGQAIKMHQDFADITGILPSNLARFESGTRVPTLIVLEKYASALGKHIKIEICDDEISW